MIMGLLVLFGCAQHEVKPPLTGEETQRVIEVEAIDQALLYRCQSSWPAEKFSEILASRDKFKTEQINSFKKSLKKYNKSAVNTKIKIDEANKSTTLMCDVKGTMYSPNSYDFHWLLADLPFDLYQFKQSEKELTYEGKVNDVPTTIRLIFPYALSHCHEHVWPR